MKRLEEIKSSKFERLSNSEMNSVKGGFCISCMKRTRKWKIGNNLNGTAGGTLYF